MPSRSIFAALIAAASILALPSASLAKHGGSGAIKVAGVCSDGSTSKLKSKLDDGRLETEFEVDQNVVGSKWDVTITDNGKTVYSHAKTTLAPSGSFSVEVRHGNQTGADNIAASATNRTTGETCTASLSI
jgi:hypothetical protein